MEKIKTNSYFVTICKSKKNTYIRRKKRKGLHAYPRILTIKDINKYIKDTSIKYPKLLKNGIKYVYEEFIESTASIENLSNLEIENNIIDIIFELNKLDIKNKKIIWNNNSEFLNFIINNFKDVLKIKNPKNLNKYLLELEDFIKDLDNDRKMSFIHGDIHRNNIVINQDDFYLIDWELATFGDLAYELATYFILMEYTNSEKDRFLNKLNGRLNINLDNLKEDVEVYISFELYRRKVLKEIKK